MPLLLDANWPPRQRVRESLCWHGVQALVSLGPALHVSGQAAGIPAAFVPRLCGVDVHAVRLLRRADVARRGHDDRGPP